jgi:DNA helicase-4
MYIVIFFVIAILSIALSITYKTRENKKRIDAERNRLEAERIKKENQEIEELKRLKEKRIENNFKTLHNKLDSIKDANKDFREFTNIENGYFSNYQLQKWRGTYRIVYDLVNNIKEDESGLEGDDYNEFYFFKVRFLKGESYRKHFNEDFVRKELTTYSDFFDNIEGKSLDAQQREAIVKDEDNNLIIAGAGSGKTLTIAAKVEYLIRRYKIDPSEILLISFTRKSSEDLSNRVRFCQAKTFHKFGLEIIGKAENVKISIAEEWRLSHFIKNEIERLTKSNDDYLRDIINYFVEHQKPIRYNDEFESFGDYIQYLKDKNFKPFKPVRTNFGNETYRRETVKSAEECRIANFLYFNNIDYEYEMPYEHDKNPNKFKQFKPDFTINPYGAKIYLEHYGINENGDVPHWFKDPQDGSGDTAKERYWQGIKWKREEHKKNKTPLIETFSYEMRNNSLFPKLIEELENNGVNVIPKPNTEIWQIIKDSNNDEFDAVIKLIVTFITLMKSNNFTMVDLRAKNNKITNESTKHRNQVFLQVIQPLFDGYNEYLRGRDEIDFSDMINKATSYIKNRKVDIDFKYIIIDEFQDLSIGRYKLLQVIKDRNPSCKVFAVGDDWQSIYRFTGSDISLFKEFEKYFGETEKSRIETTYRFGEPMISTSGDFIMKNDNQVKKNLKCGNSNRTTESKIFHVEFKDQTYDYTGVFLDIIKNIYSGGNQDNSINLILGRYTFDIELLLNIQNLIIHISNEKNDGNSHRLYKSGDWKRLLPGEEIFLEMPYQFKIFRFKYLTVHKAKGLEADYVIIPNCNNGTLGFPSEMSDDEVLNLLLSEADQFENGEERRLFYVALTRARKKVYLIAKREYKSKFIHELEINSSQSQTLKCPRCKIGDVNAKSGETNGRKWEKLSCSNYLFGCDYVKWS